MHRKHTRSVCSMRRRAKGEKLGNGMLPPVRNCYVEQGRETLVGVVPGPSARVQPLCQKEEPQHRGSTGGGGLVGERGELAPLAVGRGGPRGSLRRGGLLAAQRAEARSEVPRKLRESRALQHLGGRQRAEELAEGACRAAATAGGRSALGDASAAAEGAEAVAPEGEPVGAGGREQRGGHPELLLPGLGDEPSPVGVRASEGRAAAAAVRLPARIELWQRAPAEGAAVDLPVWRRWERAGEDKPRGDHVARQDAPRQYPQEALHRPRGGCFRLPFSLSCGARGGAAEPALLGARWHAPRHEAQAAALRGPRGDDGRCLDEAARARAGSQEHRLLDLPELDALP
mmetsp:Transcript_11570/g.27478  ORF Transcript_11570/g.27478 Transcript_11570/m.27478 type:complete len:344 (+) Transcript_11570:1456-2487(+)